MDFNFPSSSTLSFDVRFRPKLLFYNVLVWPIPVGRVKGGYQGAMEPFPEIDWLGHLIKERYKHWRSLRSRVDAFSILLQTVSHSRLPDSSDARVITNVTVTINHNNNNNNNRVVLV